MNRYYIVFILLFLFGNANAVDINVFIKGEIYIPPCVINDNTPIQFSFNDIMTYSVDGKNNAISKVIPINCEYYKGSPYVKVTGSQLLGAPDNVLKVSDKSVNSDRFGIALYQGDNININYPLRLNGSSELGYKINSGLTNIGQSKSLFQLTAVPYKLGNNNLLPGDFSASASLNIIYN